ncbi:MAG TPA: lytic murein transglycosylase [Nocardioidaceae bacterium]
MSHKRMTHKRLTTWQKATALVPLALLSGAWTTSLTVTSSASASPKHHTTRLPDGTEVPNEALEAPASMSRPGSIAPGVPDGAKDSIVASSSPNGIPAAALAAYQRSEQVMNTADRSCNLSWQLVAAIGRVESDHGRYGGNVLGKDGKSRPGIYGIPLDGSDGTAEVSDTDAGQFDNDAIYDRAVGPMQFIPQTWSVVGVDGDGDGKRDPQDIDDAALATAVYLCSGDEDLSNYGGQKAAVYRYNHSQEYVDLVISIMNAYLDGDYSSVPNGVATSPVISPGSSKAGPGASGKRKAASHHHKTRTSSGGSSGSGSGSVSRPGSGGGGGTAPTAPEQPAPDSPTSTLKDTTNKVTDTVKDTTDNTTSTTTDTLTYAEAKAKCIAQGVLAINLDSCIADLMK